MIAWVILLAVLAVGLAAFVLLPAARPAPERTAADAERAELEEERDALYRAARDLDRDLADGLIDPEEHRRLRLRDETRAALVLARLEALPPARAPGAARPALPLALAALVLIAVGAAVAHAMVVPTLQVWGLPAADREALAAARRLPALEARLSREALADPERGAAEATLLEYGEAAWEAQDYQRAARAYTILLRRDREQPTALRRYGILLFFAGRNDEALELLDASIRLEPHAEAFLNKGNLLFASGDPAGAIVAWENHQRLVPGGSDRIADLIAAARSQVGAADPGQRVFAQNCAGCHGSEGQGIVGPRLARNPEAADRALVTRQVREGEGQMPAFGPDKISDEDLERLVSFVTRLARPADSP